MFAKLFQKLPVHDITLTSPVSGVIIPLHKVSDPTFAQGILGVGTAVAPNEGRIVAPADSRVEMLFETSHAISLTTVGGVEVLIHIGLDTAALKGAHYHPRCKEGDWVRRGDILIEFNARAIKAAGYELVVPVVICNPDAWGMIESAQSGAVQAGDSLIVLKK